MHVGSMSLLQCTLYGFAVIFLGGWVFVWTLHILAIINGKLKLHRKKSVTSLEVPLQGVSILKPLTGVDSNLYCNLESFFTMNYPTYELLFCVQEEGCPSIAQVQGLMKKHPDVAARIFIGGSSIGPNPKINNMTPGYNAAKYPLIMVSDAGIRMKEDTLLDMVLCMTPDVGLVHQMPFTCDRAGFAAILEKVYFGTAHARIYLCSDLLGVNCATGMSALMRKDILDKAGGMQAFSQYLAEDYFFAKTFVDRGWKISVSSQPAWQNSGTCDVVLFQQRLTRWSKLRFAMLPHLIILEPLSECMLLGLCVAWSTSMLFGWDVAAVYLIHSLIWFLLDWMLLSIVQNGMLPFTKWEFVIAWSFREFGALYLFCQALWDPTIRWRAGTYRLSWGGQVQEIMSFQRHHKPPTLSANNNNNNNNTNSKNNHSSSNFGGSSICSIGKLRQTISPAGHGISSHMKNCDAAVAADKDGPDRINGKTAIILADDLDLSSSTNNNNSKSGGDKC